MTPSPPRFSPRPYTYAPPPPHEPPYPPSHSPYPDSDHDHPLYLAPVPERYRSQGTYRPPSPPPTYTRYPGQPPPQHIRSLPLGPPPPHPPAPPAPPRHQQPYNHRGPVQRHLPPPASPPYPTPRYSFDISPTQRLPSLHPTFNYYPRHTAYDSQHSPQLPTQQRHAAHSGPSGDGGSSSTATSTERVEQWLQQSQTTSRHDSTSSPSGTYGGGDGDVDEDDGTAPIDPSLQADEDDEDDEMAHLVSNPGDLGVLGLPGSEKRLNEEYYPNPHHQAQFAELKKDPNYKPSDMNLNSLGDGEPGERPKYYMGIIIKCAILGSPHQRLTLNELYDAIELRFSYFKNVDKKQSWKNSVRHTLSLKQQFIKAPRPITEPGKGNYWVLAPDEPQGNKRERKRNKKLGKRALAAMAKAKAKEGDSKQPPQDTVELDAHIDPSLVASTPVAAYVPSSSTTTAMPTAAAESTTAATSTSMATATNTTTTTAVTTTTVKVASVHGKTVPANEGSYAAVTGALPNPIPIDMESLLPWDGKPVYVSASASHRADVGQATSVTTMEQGTPQSALQGAILTPSIGPHRTQKTRSQLRYNPLSVSTSTALPRSTDQSSSREPRQDTFNALAAEFAQEGGGRRSGGPALKKRKRFKGDRPDMDEKESASGSEQSMDNNDEYLPGGRRKRPRR